MNDNKKKLDEENIETFDISKKYTKSPRKITEQEIESLKKLAELEKKTDLTADEATILEIITKRKFIDQITREFNLARKPFNKELFNESQIKEVLHSLEKKKLAKKIEVPKGIVWISVEHVRYKAFGTDRL
ncbi:MAG: hypothetical protein ACTSVY_10515 [Candidatus Helarchaeota archaeon]